MLLQKSNTRTVVLILMILAATAMRLVSYEFKFLSNFTPVGAIAIFGGVYFEDKWKACLVVLLTFILSDLLINHLYNAGYPPVSGDTFWNCICFVIAVLIGAAIKKVNFATGVIVLLAPVTVHWLIMDMPWINDAGGLYPKTLAGYGASLIAALPFEKNMLFGDALFGLLLFAGFELAQTKFIKLRTNKQLAT